MSRLAKRCAAAACPAGVALLAAGVLASASGCRPKDPAITEPFKDDLDRAELGAAWLNTGAPYEIAAGRLTVSRAYNHPLWLRKKLPRDVVIEVDAVSKSPTGDLKLEIFGDGESFDPDKGGYTSTGYVLIFGGWQNSLSVICRNNEHDEGRKAERRDVRVEPGSAYHFTIARQGGAIDWRIDGKTFLAWSDPEPLSGAGHEYLVFNDWEAEVGFDNLQIRPAP